MTRTGLTLWLCLSAFGCGSGPQPFAQDSGTGGSDVGTDAVDVGTGTEDAGTDAGTDAGNSDAGCACPLGEPCCDDACGFRPATHRCQGQSDQLAATRLRSSCEGACGGAATPEFEVRNCSGSSAACDGATTWEDHVLCGFVPPCFGIITCDPGERCTPVEPTLVGDITTLDTFCAPDPTCD